RSGVIMIRAASMPRNAFAEIQITSLCLIRMLSVALNDLLSKESLVRAFVLKVSNVSVLPATSSNRFFLSLLESSFSTALPVVTAFFDAQADRNSASVNPKISFLLIHIDLFFDFFMKLFIFFSACKLERLLPVTKSFFLFPQLKKDISLMFD